MTNKTHNKTLLATAAGMALAGGLATQAQAADNPFVSQLMSDGGYRQHARADGEGKCGAKMEEKAEKKAEGKCGAAHMKHNDGKCGGNMKPKAEKKGMEGKCGEGKCGGKMKPKKEKKGMEGKCGEGKCGGSMKGKG